MGRLSRGLCIATVGLLIAGAFAASAGAAIYWETNAGIGRANLDGTNPQRLFIPVPHLGVSNRVCGSVAVDHTHLYWTNTESNAVERASLDSGDVDFDFIPTATETCGVAVDQSHVYWVNSGDVTVGRANLDGTDPVQGFIEGPSRPCDVEVNAEHVFWGNVNMDWLGRADLDGESITPDFIEKLAAAVELRWQVTASTGLTLGTPSVVPTWTERSRTRIHHRLGQALRNRDSGRVHLLG